MTFRFGADQRQRLGQLARQASLAAALCASTWHLATIFDAHYPVKQWLFWHYLRCWAFGGLFALACLAPGLAVVRALAPASTSVSTRWVLGFATGVFVFGLAMFGAGAAGWWRGSTFYGVPLLLVAAGARGLWREAREWRQRAREASAGPPRPTWAYVAAGVGAIGLAVVYVPLLNPEVLAYDSRWYHLGLAEHYVAAGRIGPLVEGPLSATIPHLATFLYGWSLLCPGVAYFDKIELALHVEFIVFLGTLASVAPLVRRLLPGSRAAFGWVWIFAFPGIFVYDGILAGDADHIVALWAIPVYLTFLRAFATLAPRDCALLAVQISAVLMTKYTAVTVLVFPIAAVAARALWAAARAAFSAWRGAPRAALPRPGHWYLGPLVTVALGVALTAPHWLKNWLWYGDPLYPTLHRFLQPRPWTPDSPHWYATFKQISSSIDAVGPGTLKLALHGIYDHSFGPYGWSNMHGVYPVFGSLFTFSAVALPFARAPRRLWAFFVAICAGLVAWYLLSFQERYLQALLPLMVVFVAAIATLVWRAGLLPRLAFVALAGLQIVWGGDSIALPAHTMTRVPPLQGAFQILVTGYQKEYKNRLQPFKTLSDIGNALPANAKVVLHRIHVRLGMRRQTVTDWLPVSMGLNYGRLGSPEAAYDQLRSWGVTHLLWPSSNLTDTSDSVAGDLVFWTLALRRGEGRKAYNEYTLAALPAERPAPRGDAVLVLSCGKTYASGLYQLGDLAVPAPLPRPVAATIYPAPREALPKPDAELTKALAERAAYVVVEKACHPTARFEGFESLIARSDGLSLLAR